jgi:hypothetical protein
VPLIIDWRGGGDTCPAATTVLAAPSQPYWQQNNTTNNSSRAAPADSLALLITIRRAVAAALQLPVALLRETTTSPAPLCPPASHGCDPQLPLPLDLGALAVSALTGCSNIMDNKIHALRQVPVHDARNAGGSDGSMITPSVVVGAAGGKRGVSQLQCWDALARLQLHLLGLSVSIRLSDSLDNQQRQQQQQLEDDLILDLRQSCLCE